MRLGGDDDGRIAGMQTGADEARDLGDEERVILVELNEMLDHYCPLDGEVLRSDLRPAIAIQL